MFAIKQSSSVEIFSVKKSSIVETIQRIFVFAVKHSSIVETKLCTFSVKKSILETKIDQDELNLYVTKNISHIF